MKKNEAPERIWIDPVTDLPKLSGHIDKDSVEYILTATFIEKAVEWLQKGLDNGLWVDQHLGEREKEAVIEHFKEWMKETPLSPIK